MLFKWTLGQLFRQFFNPIALPPPRVATYDEPQDYYLLLGERYKGAKDAIRKAATVGRFDELTELLATGRDLNCEWSLALHYLLRVGKCPRQNLPALLAVVEQEGNSIEIFLA